MKTLNYIVINSLFMASLYYGYIEGVDGAKNTVAFWVWFCFVISLILNTQSAIKEMAKSEGSKIPQWLDFCIDAVALGVLVWYGAFLLSAAHIITMILVAVARHNVADARKLMEGVSK